MEESLMKKLVCVTLLIFLTFLSSVAFAQEDAYDFKQATWGMSRDEIVAFEGEPDSESVLSSDGSEITLIYNRTLCNHEATLIYYFCKNGLSMAVYVLDNNHSNGSLYIDDYHDVCDALEEKYGRPYYDDVGWYNSTKKRLYSDDMGSALLFGYLSYLTKYSTDRSDIVASMSADNYEVATMVAFISKTIRLEEIYNTNDF